MSSWALALYLFYLGNVWSGFCTLASAGLLAFFYSLGKQCAEVLVELYGEDWLEQARREGRRQCREEKR